MIKNSTITLIIVIFILIFSSIFIVDETEIAIVTQFGKYKKTINKPGLNLKLPFIQEVRKFDNRILEWDGSPNQIPTKDKKYIWIDTTARWQIADPLLFFQSVKSVDKAYSILDDVIDAVVRDFITKNFLIELVRNTKRDLMTSEGKVLKSEEFSKLKSGRENITKEMEKTAKKLLPEYGMRLIDLKIKRLNYIETVQRTIYSRMISERNKIAEQYRSEGQGEKQRILGKMQEKLKDIKSSAYRVVKELEGQADADAVKIYADAYSKNPEFYDMLKSLEVYQNIINEKTSLILTPEEKILKWLK